MKIVPNSTNEDKKNNSNFKSPTTRFEKIKKFLAKEKEPNYRFDQITRAIFQDKVGNFKKITTLSKELREKLAEKFGPLLTIKAIGKAKSKQATKILFKLKDSERIEAVKMNFINDKRKWNSFCISSQVGCALGCKFCTTGKIGLKRNLTADEIIDQILYFLLQGDKIDSFSFMGMGEPLLNPATFTAISAFIDKSLFNLSSRKISVSTVGILPGLEKLINNFPQINIAFSLHTPFQKQREELMPIAKQYSIEQIMELLDAYIRKNKRKVFLPYLMLKEINDTPQHLRALEQLILKRKDVAYLYHVNLIRYHSSPLMGKKFQCSSKKTIDWFKRELEKTRIGVTIRESFGEDAYAACGQLYAEYKKFVSPASS